MGAPRGPSGGHPSRGTQRHLSPSSQWRKGGGHRGLRQSRKDAGVDQVTDSGLLLVGAPRPFNGLEIEAVLLAEQSHQLEPMPSMADLAQRRVDRRPQRRGAEDLGGFLKDAVINLDRCLTPRRDDVTKEFEVRPTLAEGTISGGRCVPLLCPYQRTRVVAEGRYRSGFRWPERDFRGVGPG
jgi:hypothetical protein